MGQTDPVQISLHRCSGASATCAASCRGILQAEGLPKVRRHLSLCRPPRESPSLQAIWLAQVSVHLCQWIRPGKENRLWHALLPPILPPTGPSLPTSAPIHILLRPILPPPCLPSPLPLLLHYSAWNVPSMHCFLCWFLTWHAVTRNFMECTLATACTRGACTLLAQRGIGSCC